MMDNGLCHIGTLESLGNFGIWGWTGLILNLVFWVGLISSLTWLVVLVVRRARDRATTVPNATGTPSAKEILQAKYARGEINHEQYELGKQEIG